MPAFICTTCGTQYAPTDAPPKACPICDDERQYVPPPGQGWTTLDTLAKRNMNAWRELEPNLISITTAPAFGIGQRAQLLRTPQGNILWDCISLIDRATIEMIKAMGGLKSIAISHPHYYSCMVEWSQAFGGIPIHLHAADRKWIMRDDSAIALWQGETKELAPDVDRLGTLLFCDPMADPISRARSHDEVEPVTRGMRIGTGQDFNNITILNLRSQRNHATVNTRAGAGVADFRVNHVSKIDGRCTARKLYDLAHRSERVNVLGIKIELE